MPAGDGVNVGQIFGRLGFRFDNSGSREFEQARQKHEQETKDPINQTLGFEVDDKVLADYNRELDKVRAKTQRKSDFQAKLGADFDSRAFRQYEAELQKAQREAQRMEAQQVRLAAVGDRSSHSFDMSNRSVEAFAGGLRKLFNESAKITVVGVALQGISAGAAGLGAAAAGLAPLAGGLAAYPALASAAAQGLGVFKLATSGVFQAVGGLNEKLDTSSKKFKELTPEAQSFARQLDALKAPLRGLSTDAQKGLFPGFEQGIKDASKNLPVFHGIVKETAGALGDIAAQAGKLVGSGAWGRDIATQGDRNATTIKRAGEVGLNLADALRHVTIAAGPLVDWLTRSAVKFSELIDNQAKAGRESGTLAEFFDKTQVAISRVSRIAADLGAVLLNVGKAAYPLGNDLLKSLTLNVDTFRKWTDSAKGQNSIRQFFADARPAVYELGKLIAAAAVDFAKLGKGEQVAPLLRAIRVDLLPAITQLVQGTTSAFGPVFIDAVKQAIILFTHLGGSSGPLILFTTSLDNALKLINNIIDRIPVIGTAIAALAATGGIAKVLGVGSASGGIRSISGALSRVTGGGADGAAGGGASRVLSLFAGRGETPAKPLFVWTVNGGGGGGGGLPGTVAKDAGKGAGAGGIAGVARAIGGAALGDAGIAAAGVGLPLALIKLEQERNPIDKLTATLDQLIDAPRGSARFDQLSKLEGALRKAVAAGDSRKLADIATQIDAVGKSANGLNTDKWSDLATQVDNLAKSDGWKQAQGEAKETAARFKQMRDLTRGDLQDINDAVKDNMGRIQQRLGFDSAAGKAALADNFDQAIAAIRSSMSAGVVATKKGMTDIRAYVSQELGIYGVSLAKAKSIAAQGYTGDDAFRAAGRGQGEGKAGGGWIGQPGMVGTDTVPALLAPGEAVLNRHQQAVIEGMLGGGFLDRLFSSVTTPHYLAKGGRAVQRFAGGGYPMVSGDTDFVPALGRALSQMARAAGQSIFVSSGRRTLAEQAALAQSKGVYGPGNPTGAAAPSANAPHVRGVAADISPGRSVFGALASRFGLGFTVPTEAWHIQLLNAAAAGAGAAGASVSVPRVAIQGGGAIGRVAQAALDLVRGGAGRLLTNASLVPAAGESAPAASGGSPAGSSQVRAWVAAGLRLAGFSATGANVALETGLAMKESSGNPGIVNTKDINAQRGDPSIGLMQITGSNFRKYMIPGHGNIRNPIDNVAASARYQLATYGKLIGFSPYSLGGRVGRAVQRFAGGGRVLGAVQLSANGSGATAQGFSLKATQRQITHRISDYDALMGDRGAVALDRTRYSIAERKYNDVDGDLVDPTTGAVNQSVLQRKEQALFGMVAIARRIQDNLIKAREIAKRIAASYREVVKRLRESLKHAGKKNRSGISQQLADAKTGEAEYEGALSDLTNDDVPNAKLDLSELGKEFTALSNTQPGTPAADSSGAATGGDTAATGSDTSGGLTADQQALLDQAQSLKDIVAKGDYINAVALRTINTFNGVPTASTSQGPPSAAGASLVAAQSGGATWAGKPTPTTVVNINTLHPGDSRTLAAVARASNGGNGSLLLDKNSSLRVGP